MIQLDEFKQKCLKGHCLRKSIKSKQCLKSSKQESCYRRYEKTSDRKVEIDFKWKDLQSRIRERDGSCVLWKILTKEEKDYFFEFQKENYWLVKKSDDVAHILPRSVYPDLKYDDSNVVLLNRLMHSRLDSFQNPLTGENISKEDSEKWWERIMIQNGYWQEGYTFEQFRNEKEGHS